MPRRLAKFEHSACNQLKILEFFQQDHHGLLRPSLVAALSRHNFRTADVSGVTMATDLWPVWRMMERLEAP